MMQVENNEGNIHRRDEKLTHTITLKIYTSIKRQNTLTP